MSFASLQDDLDTVLSVCTDEESQHAFMRLVGALEGEDYPSAVEAVRAWRAATHT